MKASELKEKSEQELKEELLALRREQFNLRMQFSTGQMIQTHQFRQVRRSIARVKTVLNQAHRETAETGNAE